MSPATRARLRRFIIGAGMTIAVTTAAGYLIGPRAALAAAVIGFLGTAAAADDKLGTCLPLAVFFLIGLTLLVLTFVGVILVNT